MTDEEFLRQHNIDLKKLRDEQRRLHERLATDQREANDVLLDLADSQRVFTSNYGDAISQLTRSLVSQVTITTAAGVVLGGLVGVRRR